MEVSWRFREPSGKSWRFDLLLNKPGGVSDRQRAGSELEGKLIPPHTPWISASWNQETLSTADASEARGRVVLCMRAQPALQTLLCFTTENQQARELRRRLKVISGYQPLMAGPGLTLSHHLPRGPLVWFLHLSRSSTVDSTVSPCRGPTSIPKHTREVPGSSGSSPLHNSLQNLLRHPLSHPGL